MIMMTEKHDTCRCSVVFNNVSRCNCICLHELGTFRIITFLPKMIICLSRRRQFAFIGKSVGGAYWRGREVCFLEIANSKYGYFIESIF